MTTATLTAPRADVRPVSFPRIVSSEWIKLRSVRATYWSLSIMVVVMAALGALSAWSSLAFREMSDDVGVPEFAPASYPISGWFFAQLIVVVLGALTITGEYSTGMIRSTFAAVPSRVPALLGKAVTLFATVLVTAFVAVGLAWLASLPFLSQLGISIDVRSAESLRLLLGTPLLLATIAVFALAIGALVRHSAGALAIVIGLLLVVESVFGSLNIRFFQVISPFMPGRASAQLLMEDQYLTFDATLRDTVQLTPWQGYGVLVAWVVALLVAASIVMRRRDA